MGTQFAAKEFSRFTSKPEEQDWRSVKRLARCPKDNKRVVNERKLQRLPEKVVWSDADFAGRRRTRISTSGGVVMFATHCIKTYTQTQETVALSFRNLEFYGIAKAATIAPGIQGLMEECGS